MVIEERFCDEITYKKMDDRSIYALKKYALSNMRHNRTYYITDIDNDKIIIVITNKEYYSGIGLLRQYGRIKLSNFKGL